MVNVDGFVECAATFGTSDHFSISFTIRNDAEIPDVVVAHSSLSWKKAPWPHIRGDVGRAEQLAAARDYQTREDACSY